MASGRGRACWRWRFPYCLKSPTSWISPSWLRDEVFGACVSVEAGARYQQGQVNYNQYALLFAIAGDLPEFVLWTRWNAMKIIPKSSQSRAASGLPDRAGN